MSDGPVSTEMAKVRGLRPRVINPYRTADWRAFRDKIIERDGRGCVRCLRTPDQDRVTLQVHHTQYLPKRLPWEYPEELCETLCKHCHAIEHGLVRPTRDWEHLGFEDLGGLNGTCDLCGTSIRYVYLVHHAKWPAMEVGETCCDHMTGTTFASEYHRYLDRVESFVSSSRWQTDTNGNQWIMQRGIKLGIVADGTAFKISMANVEGKLTFANREDAKIRAYDLIATGEAQAFLAKLK